MNHWENWEIIGKDSHHNDLEDKLTKKSRVDIQLHKLLKNLTEAYIIVYL